MSRAKLRNVWSDLLVRGALLLVASPRWQRPSGCQTTIDKPIRSGTDEVVVKIDGDNILISQDGRNFEELRLGDMREALHLRKLLRDEVSDGRSITVPVGSMIVASGGASGRGWGWKLLNNRPRRSLQKKKAANDLPAPRDFSLAAVVSRAATDVAGLADVLLGSPCQVV